MDDDHYIAAPKYWSTNLTRHLMKLGRRDFVKKIACATTLAPLVHTPFKSFAFGQLEEPLEVHLFSKHLQFLDYQTAGQMAAEMGFSGVDLTVRPKGHVLPERVTADLPRAVADIKKGGSRCEMITTSIAGVDNPLDRDIISSAAKEGVSYYRTHWFKYPKDKPMAASLDYFQEQVKQLSEFNKRKGIIGYYQNHAGTNIGASFWEVKKILETADPAYFGTQYDIRHAVAEGGHSWINGLQLLHPYIKAIVLKDFKWGKVNGKWKAINTPIGEGMVDFDRYFKLLKHYKLKPPVSLHLEYPLGGAEKGHANITVDKKVVFDAMKKDLKLIQELWKKA